MVRLLNETLKRWRVRAVFEEGKGLETRTIIAHAHRQDSSGGHRFYTRGPLFNSPSVTVQYVGPGLCRSVELIGPVA